MSYRPQISKPAGAKIKRPMTGDPITRRMMTAMANAANHINEAPEPGQAFLRWAVTCKDDETDSYPEKHSQPFAYPFRWVFPDTKDNAPSGYGLPAQDGQDRKHWDAVELLESPSIDGWAVNARELQFPLSDSVTTPEDYLLDYIHEGEKILVAFMYGGYMIVRPTVERFYFKSTEAIASASISTSDPENSVYYSGKCNVYTIGASATPGEFRPRAMKDENDQLIEWDVINPSSSSPIPINTQFWGEKWAGGIYTATIWVC